MNNEEKNNYCVITIPIEINSAQNDTLNRVFEQARQLYNAIQQKMISHYKYITSSKAYQEADNKGKKKIILNYTLPFKMARGGYADKKVFAKLGGFACLSTKLGKYYPLLNSVQCQMIGEHCYDAWDKMLNGFGGQKGKKVHLKNENDTMSLPTKMSGGYLIGLKFNEDYRALFMKIGNQQYNGNKTLCCPLRWGRTEYDLYTIDAVKRGKYTNASIVRKKVRNKMYYELHLTMKDSPYNKMRTLGQGNVGIDIGTSTVTAYGPELKMEVLSFDEQNKYAKRLKQLQRLMDRSRRSTNPENFNEDGTIRKPSNGSVLTWVKSKKYKQYEAEYAEIYRKLTIKRKLHHNLLANSMLCLGDTFNIEKNNIKAMAKRKKETKINTKTGKCYSKKRYGSTINTNAPSEFLTIFKNKAIALGATVNDIPAQMAASQFDFSAQDFIKHDVSERNITLSNGDKHTRDGIAAFNLKHCNPKVNEKNADNYNIDTMNQDYANFCAAEAIEINAHKSGAKRTKSAMGLKEM